MAETQKDPPTDDPEDVLAEARLPKGKKPWIAGRWNDMPQWKCRACPWDTLAGEEAFMDHWKHVHAPANTAARREQGRTLPILDRFGNPVVVNQE